MGINKDKILKVVKFSFPLLLLIFALVEMRKFTRDINVHLLRNELDQLNIALLLLILAITFAAVLPMVLYDVILFRILKIKVLKWELLEQSFIANSFSNLIGFGGIVGAMLRTYFFLKLEHEKRRLLGLIASVSLFYLTGISFLSWIVTTSYRHYPLFVHNRWLYFAAVGVGLYLPVFYLIHTFQAKKEQKSLIPTKAGFGLIGVSIIEWFAVFSAIFVLNKLLGMNVSIPNLFPVYIVAACAGIISMIPGGLGSFDLVFLWGMKNLHVGEEKVLVLLLFYRIGYYFVPFLISLVFFIKLYWKKWNQSWNDLPKAIIQRLSHIILTILVFSSGLIMLLSASIPGIMSRLRIARELLSFPIINVSHQLSVAAGFLLLGLSRGIEYRVKRTYELTMFALILAALFSIFKGIDYEEAIFLIIVALILRLSKGQFYRESYVLTWGKTIFDVTVIFLITSMYLIIGYLNLPSAKLAIPKRFIPYVIVNYRDLFFSAIIGLLIASIILMLGYLISLPRKWKFEMSETQEKAIDSHLRKYEGNTVAHLLFLHDKYLFWNRKKTVLIPFQKYADKLVILGDPIGEKNDLSNAIDEFQEKADLHGYTLVFYQVSDEMLPYLHNHGFAFFKLGEEAHVDLGSFSISAINGITDFESTFQRNYSYKVIEPPFTEDLLLQLREISDEWLQGRNEQGYAVGFFHDGYLNKSPIVIAQDDNMQIIGFMNIMYIYDHDRTAGVDLIRLKSEASEGTIDSLLITLMKWARARGYSRFNLGMAPLANVGLSKFAFLSEKIAAQIFLHGHFISQVQGLRNFKEKYADKWEPKYLAYRRKSSLPFIMAQITLLISKKRTS
ncbi:bifunctional lysylphosphatidylglycerol flippase/synthetase MprF [Bacillus sp. BRMEA1]|uniref:bifunctional lysylphosphatidylglycerol flippase/synthetase MprF n=1 Tax=Neobacillus endophyticus TaxID=2738405 RepID=UPI001566F8E8|nr:bifunctional lysylphosphatidylglycerol flippase/synthetase MprF [Neobacillus endophyticus]NRD80425.1 bifunctional lysylphosphatidylglycerol flippase/synthetase MprF [Neobacillus endophyticus]